MSFESKLETRRDDFVHGHNGTDEKIMVGDDSIDMLGSSVKSATTTSIRSGKSLWSSPSSSPTKVSHSILDTSGEDGVDCEMGISEAKRSKETDVSEHLKVTPVRGNSTSVRGDKDDGNARGKGSDSYILQTIPTSCFREFIIKFAVHNRWVVTSMIVTLGIAAAIAFMFLGIESSRRFDDQYFTQTGQDLANSIKSAWHDYEIYSLWAHQSCQRHHSLDDGFDTATYKNSSEQSLNDELEICSRAEFRNMYEHVLSLGLDIYSIQYATRVEHEFRDAYEADSKQFLAMNYPAVEYQGITVRDMSVPGKLKAQSNKPFYYPLARLEPIEGNIPAIDLDVYESSSELIDGVLSYWQPTLSPGIKLIQDDDPDAYSVYLVHPGTKTSVMGDCVPHSVTSTVIRIPDLLKRAGQEAITNLAVYLYDSSDESMDPSFLGAMKIFQGSSSSNDHQKSHLEIIKAIPFANALLSGDSGRIFMKELQVVDRQWTILCVPLDDFHNSSLAFVFVGFAVIIVAFLLLAGIAFIRSKAEAEKARLSSQQVDRERQLNEYLAHEVRNPLSSAISALSFVSATTLEKVKDEEVRNLLNHDIRIADCSLNFINELLRNMLDINRATNRRLKINMSPTDLLRDILEPAGGILCLRGSKEAVKILTDCPPDLIVETDKLRLKQIICNLATNSTKFVNYGFIRLRAELCDGSVVLYVEDSGPGIPPDKQDGIFRHLQESFDLLSQGTGIGLYVCQHLCDLMGATISLDRTYDSGIEGCPGTRFVIDLQRPPVDKVASTEIFRSGCEDDQDTDQIDSYTDQSPPAQSPGLSIGHDKSNRPVPPEPSIHIKKESKTREAANDSIEIPKHLKVLFVDDDMIVRKLFIRSVRRCCPSWDIEEASNGEAALQMMDKFSFDVIFMDMYMPCHGRSLLGTETVRMMRIKGARSVICGCSANEMEAEFLESGADAFVIKPFPCEKESLMVELRRILASRESDHKYSAYHRSHSQNTEGALTA